MNYTPPTSGHPTPAMSMPERHAAGAPSAGAVITPGFGDEDRQRMQRESEATRYAKLEERVQYLQAQTEVAHLRYQRSECERMITQVESEGYELDRAAEVDRMVPLDEANRQKHLEYVRKYWTRRVPPINNSPLDYMLRNGNAGAKKFGKAEQEQAIRMVQKGECKTMEEAVEKLTKAN